MKDEPKEFDESDNCFCSAVDLCIKTFSGLEEIHHYYPVFIDISYKSDKGKSDPSVRLRFENKIEDIANINYVLNSKKIIEIYSKKFAEKADILAIEFKKRFNQDFYIVNKF